MSTFPQRVQEVANDIGGQSELARRVSRILNREVKPGAISNLCRDGHKPPRSSAYSPAIAQAGNVRLEWLVTGALPKREEENPEQAKNYLPLLLLGSEARSPLMATKSWLQGQGLDPDHARLFILPDESMSPNFPKNSMLLINKNVSTLESGKAYLFSFHEQQLVKRVFLQLDGRWNLRYDNPDKALFPDEIISQEQIEKLEIVGKIVTPMGISQ